MTTILPSDRERAAELISGALKSWPSAHKLLTPIALALAETREKATVDEREACAKVCEDQAQVFLSPSYATEQPLSSFHERFACKLLAEAIRARGGKE